jgi:transposase-like protein
MGTEFGPAIARNLRRGRSVAHDRWHLGELVVSIAGRGMYMWRAVDGEGEVLDMLVQPRLDKPAAFKLLRKLLKRQGFAPSVIVTDKLRSYGAALPLVGFSGQHDQGLRANNRAENSHQPVRRRERKMQASSRPARPSASSPSTPPFTTPSTSSDLSSLVPLPPLPLCRSLHLEQRDRYGLKAGERDPAASDLC